MKRHLQRFGGFSVLALSMLAGVAVTSAPASAQMVFKTREGGPGGGRNFEPPVSSRQLERFADKLELNADQREAAKSLLEGMQSEFQTLAAKSREEMKALRDEFEETQDPAVFGEKMPAIMDRLSQGRKQQEQTFFDDLKAMLDDHQAAKWPSVERMHRRDQGLSRGTLSGESVDLTRVVDDLKLAPESKSTVTPILDQYEVDLDRVLTDRIKIQDATLPGMFGPGGPKAAERRAQAEDFKKALEDMREASKKVRDVNQRYARQIQGALSEGDAAKFEKSVRKESFPQVYRESYAQRALKAAEEFGDLTPEQKKTISDLKSRYEREAESINSKWSSAIADQEAKGAGTMMGGGGMFIRTMDEGEDGKPDPAAEQRDARRKLDESTLEGLKSGLNEDQKSRLPERRQRGPEGEGGPREGTAVFIGMTETADGEGQQTTVHAVSVSSSDAAPADGVEGETEVVVVGGAGGAAPSDAKPSEGKPAAKQPAKQAEPKKPA